MEPKKSASKKNPKAGEEDEDGMEDEEEDPTQCVRRGSVLFQLWSTEEISASLST